MRDPIPEAYLEVNLYKQHFVSWIIQLHVFLKQQTMRKLKYSDFHLNRYLTFLCKKTSLIS